MDMIVFLKFSVSTYLWFYTVDQVHKRDREAPEKVMIAENPWLSYSLLMASF